MAAMSQVFPLVLPESLVDRFHLDLSLPERDWGVDSHDVVVAPSGDVYAHYGVHRFGWDVEDDETDPARVRFSYRIATRYSAAGEPLSTALFHPRWAAGEATAVAGVGLMCVLPDGTPVVTGHTDCTTLLEPDLSAVRRAYAAEGRRSFEPVLPGDPFASSVDVTPSGRLLCVTTEYGVHEYGNSIANIVGIADGPLSAASKPVIRAIASLDPNPARHTEDDLRPHVVHGGAPVGLANRPRPSLAESFAAEDPQSSWHRSTLGHPAPLADDLFVVPFFARTYRSGSRGQPFVFALLDDQGEVRGRLGGMDFRRDSPFTGSDFTVAADAHRGRAFHLNRYGLYAWDRTGELRARLDTATKEFRLLTRFTLARCSPEGDLLLMHAKQGLVLRVPTPDDLDDLGATLEQALRAFARDRTALKKLWSPTAWHWVQPDATVHEL